MLVLTRRANQSIMIGHEIVVTVLEVRGDQVRLGIKAPRSIDVHREEIFAQLQQANRDAVRFLARCEAAGTTLAHCPAYIREWIEREKD